jgi:hypothetical protein
MFYVQQHFSENRALYEPEKLQMTIRHMRIAYWIRKAKRQAHAYVDVKLSLK